MWTYPKRRTPDPDAPKNVVSAEDLDDAEKERAVEKKKADAKSAKVEAEVKADQAKVDLKKEVAASKANEAKQ
jgi:hypothetical protein